MAYDEGLAVRVEETLADLEAPNLVSKKMFGGVCFLVRGNMACGITKDSLISRVGPKKYEDALKRPHAAVFDMTGRPMKGWVMVSPGGLEDDEDLTLWVKDGLELAMSLPAQ